MTKPDNCIANNQIPANISRPEEVIDCLQLIRSENVGPSNYKYLVKLFGSAKQALEAIPLLSERGGRQKPIKLCEKSEAEQEIEKCTKFGARIITYQDKDYPKLLLQIYDYPPVLTVLGNTALLNNHNIAMVGSRNASINGSRFAHNLAADLGKKGVTIVSGLARGIDASAHNGALASNTTIAVVAGGIDKIYPQENTGLYYKIAEQGAIVAELPFATTPRGQHFPQRNRIISGMSYGVVVVEASLGSGSLITASNALEQNREIFAVPGFPLDPRCRGTNYLIKQGAKLTESADDILTELDLLKWHNDNSLDISMDSKIDNNFNYNDNEIMQEARLVIKNMLNSHPLNIDEIVAASELDLKTVLAVILELELAGKITRNRGNKISLQFE